MRLVIAQMELIPILADTDGDGRNDLIDVFPCNGSGWLDCDSDGTV